MDRRSTASPWGRSRTVTLRAGRDGNGNGNASLRRHGRLRPATLRALPLSTYLPALLVVVSTLVVGLLVTATLPASATGPSTLNSGALTLDPEEKRILTALNQERAAQSLPPLALSPILNAAADWMVHDLTNNRRLSHIDSLGRGLGDRLAAFGYSSTATVSENVGREFSSGSEFVAAALESPAHRANLLSANARAVGIARASLQDGSGRWYWVTDFGSALDAGPPRRTTRTALLRPGWNLVSWLGIATATATATAPLGSTVDQLLSWDAAAGNWRWFSLAARRGSLATLDNGDAVWVHVTAAAPLYWPQAVPRPLPRLLDTPPGWTLTAWTGPDVTPLAKAVASLGDRVSAVASFDAAQQEYRLYRPDLPWLGAAPILSHGDAFWIRLRSAGTWAQAAP